MVRGKREKRKRPNKNKLGLLINHYSNTTTLEITNLYITQSSIKRAIFSALIKKYIEKKLDQTEPRFIERILLYLACFKIVSNVYAANELSLQWFISKLLSLLFGFFPFFILPFSIFQRQRCCN